MLPTPGGAAGEASSKGGGWASDYGAPRSMGSSRDREVLPNETDFAINDERV